MKRSIRGIFARAALPFFTSLLAVSLVLSVIGCPASLSTEPPEAWVEVAGQRLAVELADTPQKQQLGLGHRDALPWNTGMYFPYEHPAIYTFWMKGMRFSIDIVWIRNGRIIDVHTDGFGVHRVHRMFSVHVGADAAQLLGFCDYMEG